MVGYFDPEIEVDVLTGNLPHWRQDRVTYFVTFRLGDSLPQDKLDAWRAEIKIWLEKHPEPHDLETRRDFYERFPERFQQWLDLNHGSCVLRLPEVCGVVVESLKYFEGARYGLAEFVVAPNHVHALVTPLGEYRLSSIMQTWKSFTAHEIVKRG
jgi:type I restriction enzyme R subunit